MMDSIESGESNGAYITPVNSRDIIIGSKCSHGHRGPSTLDLPGTGYSADTYNKGSYVAEKEVLAEMATKIVISSGLWTPETARIMIASGLDVSDPQTTSWIGFRKTDTPKGQYSGFAWQEEVRIPTHRGDRCTLYMKLRAFEPEMQGQGFGGTAMQLNLYTHNEVDSVAHRSGNPVAVRSWLKLKEFKQGRRFPYDLPFDADEEQPHLLLWIYSRYHTRGKTPSMSTGVSVSDYIEPNGAIPREITGPTKDIFDWMTEKKIIEIEGKKRKGLGIVLDRGDALYEIGELA